MAAVIQVHKPALAGIAFSKKGDEIIKKLFPRRCMVVSVVMLLVGMDLPLLMVVHLLSTNLLLCLVGFAMVATGGTLALFFCGEI